MGETYEFGESSREPGPFGILWDELSGQVESHHLAFTPEAAVFAREVCRRAESTLAAVPASKRSAARDRTREAIQGLMRHFEGHALRAMTADDETDEARYVDLEQWREALRSLCPLFPFC
jgi:hypothetical protein